MPDILTHVLVGYVLGTTLSFRREWLTPPLVTVVMLGALVPDLSKIDLLLLGEYVETLLGVPFEWRAIHMFGGALVAGSVAAVVWYVRYRMVPVESPARLSLSPFPVDTDCCDPFSRCIDCVILLTVSRPAL